MKTKEKQNEKIDITYGVNDSNRDFRLFEERGLQVVPFDRMSEQLHLWGVFMYETAERDLWDLREF